MIRLIARIWARFEFELARERALLRRTTEAAASIHRGPLARAAQQAADEIKLRRVLHAALHRYSPQQPIGEA